MILISMAWWEEEEEEESSQGNAYLCWKAHKTKRGRKNSIKNQIELVEWEWIEWIKT